MSYDDVYYLCNLSLDAAPELSKIDQKSDYNNMLKDYFKQIREENQVTIRKFNLSKYQAIKAADSVIQ